MEGEEDVHGGVQIEGEEHAWTLRDLTRSFQEVTELPSPSNRQLRRLVALLSDEWLVADVGLDNMLSWSLERLQLSIDGEFFFKDIEDAVRFRRYQYKTLRRFLDERKLMDDDGNLVDLVHKISRMITSTYTVCKNAWIQYSRMTDDRTLRIPPDVQEEDKECFIDGMYDEESMTSFQRIVIEMCKRFEAKGYRKSGDACYTQILTDPVIDPETGIEVCYRTRAYEYAGTIKEEIYQIEKEVDMRMWRLVTNPRDNPRAVQEHLIESEQSEFRTLDVGDGFFFSYADGIYDIRNDLFYRYDQLAEWGDYAAAMKAARVEEATRLEANIECYPEEVRPRILDECARFREELHEYQPPNDESVSVNYFPIPFRFDAMDPSNCAETMMFDPMDIATPAFDRILDSQGYDVDTKRMVFVLVGRLFFLINTLDRWSRALFVIGAGGTGKSTIANWLMHVIPAHFHSIVNANFEEQFGLSGITSEQKRLCLCTELTEDLRFKQEEWQIAVEGGKLQVAHKNQTSRPHQFKQHMFWVGNQFPRRWKNNAKQVSRRIILLAFKNHIPKTQLQGNLNDDLIAETDLIMRKATLLYVRMAHKYGQCDLEAPGILPPQISEFMKELEDTMDVLTSFVNSDMIELTPKDADPTEFYYVSAKDFKREYFEYRRANGHPPVPWTKDHYESILASYGCKLKDRSLPYPKADSVPKYQDYIIGLRIREEQMDDVVMGPEGM